MISMNINTVGQIVPSSNFFNVNTKRLEVGCYFSQQTLTLFLSRKRLFWSYTIRAKKFCKVYASGWKTGFQKSFEEHYGRNHLI